MRRGSIKMNETTATENIECIKETTIDKNRNMRLPGEILQMIGGYLDLETLVSFNRAVPVELRVRRKLGFDPDLHNDRVKQKFYKKKIDKIINTIGVEKRGLLTKEFLIHLLLTKDNIIFKNKTLVDIMYKKCISLKEQTIHEINIGTLETYDPVETRRRIKNFRGTIYICDKLRKKAEFYRNSVE